MASETHVDVLVIGAGPAGLMCANALARGGINVKIIDKRPVKVAEGQADGIQPRSIEVLQSYGLADRLLKEGAHMHIAAFYNPSPSGGIERTMRGPDVATKAPLFCRYPHEVTLHQGAIESLFLDSMAEHGLQVSRPRAPTAIEISDNEEELKDPNSYPVKITVQRLDAKEGEQDTEIIRAKYCVGADGAHSWVRKNFGIAMEGEQTNFVWGVVDTKPTTNFPDVRNKCLIHANTGTCLFIPREDDKVRLYVQMAEIPLSVGGRVDKTGMGPEKILEVASKALPPYTISFPKEIDWWTLYIVGQRVASSYSVKDRVYISGDACHSHSPKAGQGMNAGFNDSHNLAWKLVHVLRGWAAPSLLDTYEFERRKFAQDLIAFDRKWSRLFSGKPRTEENQDGVSHQEFSGIFETFGNFTSGVGITYNPSALVDTQYQSVATNLTIGQRLPPQTIIRTADGRPFEIQDLMPADLRHKVIIFAGDSSSTSQLAVLKELADHLDTPKGFVKRFTPKGASFNAVFDMIPITNTNKYVANYNDLPERLWSHWSKVFTDDEAYGNGGKLYQSYGVSPQGGIAMVRPDGYVGFVAPLSVQGAEAIGQYLGGFMKECTA